MAIDNNQDFADALLAVASAPAVGAAEKLASQGRLIEQTMELFQYRLLAMAIWSVDYALRKAIGASRAANVVKLMMKSLQTGYPPAYKEASDILKIISKTASNPENIQDFGGESGAASEAFAHAVVGLFPTDDAASLAEALSADVIRQASAVIARNQ